MTEDEFINNGSKFCLGEQRVNGKPCWKFIAISQLLDIYIWCIGGTHRREVKGSQVFVPEEREKNGEYE